jgi:intein/homing endonuclease
VPQAARGETRGLNLFYWENAMLPNVKAQNGNGNGHSRPSLFPELRITPASIVKRDGRVVPFDITRIENALNKCFASLGYKPVTPIPDLARQAVNIVAAKYEQPTVEQVQDVVETVLQSAGEYEAAKHYILYRAEHAKIRQQRPIPDVVRIAFDESDRFFPTQLQKFQFYDKYARFNYELGRRETWIETVDRAVDYLHELAGDRLPSATYQRVRQSILSMQAMPSMRLLAMAGEAARRNNIAIYNCSYQPVESIDSFVEALIISMSGCGVGYSVERKYVENFPRIKRQSGHKPVTLVVEDSAEGWADALRIGLQTWFDGGDVKFDLTQLRPAGTPLKTKGGRASGPEPFRVMLDFARARILARQGSFLRPIDAHDIMCAVGNAAVSGGVRRTAMISLFDADDDEMRLAKSGDFERENSQRWNANNSAVWNEGGLTQQEFIQHFFEMVQSGRGEPGIFSRAAANSMKSPRRVEADFGTNPCITADAWVMTADGARQVSDLIGRDFTAVVNGQRHAATGFWETGVKPVLKLKTKEGYNLRLTANHKVLAVPYISRKIEKPEWVEAGELKPGDKIKLNDHRDFAWEGDGTFDEGWLLGALVGDGTFDEKLARLTFWGQHRAQMAEQAVNALRASVKVRSDLAGHDQAQYDRTIVSSAGLRDLAADYGIYRGMKSITPFVEQASSAFYCGFLQGLFDTDGTVIGTQAKGLSVRLAQSDVALLEAAQRMLLRLGIASTIYENRRPAGPRLMPDGRGGYAEYNTLASHELVISNDNLAVFAELIGFSDPDKRERLASKLDGYRREMNRERFVATVESIEPDGVEMVYDCSVAGLHAFDANGLYVHNCGEINLRPWEFCNLTAAVARVNDTFDTLRDKVEVATIIGTIQSLATHFPGLRPMWQQNCEDERLLGVDITGQMDSPIAQDGPVKAQLREIAVELNRALAGQLGINPSAAITCVKPSGNSSQLLDCASGLHARHAPYYIRNVRVSAHSPVYKVLRDAGAPMDPENGQTADGATTWVVHFPVKSPEGAVTRNDRGAVEQCEYWLQNKLYWTEHNPSCTITYQPDEVIDLMKWVWEHREQVGGLSFLPSFDANYAQMPYVEIGKDEYERLAAAFPNIDFAKLYYYEDEDLTTASMELACVAGNCEIDYVPGK